MNFHNINLKFQKVLIILICSIIITTGVSVFGYLNNNDAKESFKTYIIDECESIAIAAQKYASTDKSGFIDWRLPISYEKVHSINHVIIKSSEDFLIIYSTPKVVQKGFSAIETHITLDQINIKVIE